MFIKTKNFTLPYMISSLIIDCVVSVNYYKQFDVTIR